MKKYIYLYGMVLASTGFLLDELVKPDAYTEIKGKYRLPGGETGTCATVLASLGKRTRLDGNHIGYAVEPVLRSYYADKPVELDSLFFDNDYEGLEDYILIAQDFRSPMGQFAQFYAEGKKRWNEPREEDIENCTCAAIDPFFGEQSQAAAQLCVKHKKPYVTIDCPFDSYLHEHAAITVISGEDLRGRYPGKTQEEMLAHYCEHGSGLTIITNGGGEFVYGRKPGEIKRYMPFKVNVVSTLGAGDSFKAGCTYALDEAMSYDETVSFASACAAVAITRFPIPLKPPTLEEIENLIKSR